MQRVGFLSILPTLPILLAHLGGAIAAIILLSRYQQKRSPALLALIGFGTLFVTDLASFARAPLAGLLYRQAPGVQRFWTVNTSLGCCCSVIDVAAIVCLIFALWQAISGPDAASEGDEPLT